MSYTPIPTRTEADLNSSADINQLMANIEYLKERLENYPLENLYPIGERYIQLPEPDGSFPAAKSPENKFGGEWVCIFDDEGVFFRTEWTDEPEEYYNSGSLVPYRVDGLSEDKMQRLYGNILNHGPGGFNRNFNSSNITQSGAIYMHTFSGDRYSSGSGDSVARGLRFESSLSPYSKTTADTDGRTEPKNRLMRIWERIA